VIISENQRSSAGSPLDLNSIRQGLTAQRLGTEIHYFAEIGSTNTYARRLAAQGARDGALIIADSQTDGRGRLGRHWVSPPNMNLYLSFVLRPKLPPSRAPQITLMAAVALADALRSFLPVPPAIKWPNDITVNGKKLAGILTEMSCGDDTVDFVIVGIGINVNYPFDLMPEEIRQRATSILVERQRNVSREDLLWRLIKDLDRCYGELEENGFALLASRWEAYFGWRGRRVRIEILDQVLFGTAKGIDHDGALLLEDDHGKLHRVIAGDVTPVNP
jgi:BirA family transcriptional regulator, biotin operon repressor / biotin---[acetyl-CoA-carboxylase] ligase